MKRIKSLGLLTRDEYLGNLLATQLNSVFGSAITIEQQYYIGNNNAVPFQSDVVLVSGITVEIEGRRFNLIRKDAAVIVAQRMIINPDSVEAVQALLQIKKGTKVVIASNECKVVEDLINELKDIGVEHLIFIPHYPQCPEIPKDAKVAVVFGNAAAAPPDMEQVIDMGARLLGVQTLLRIVQIFDLKENDINLSFIKKYIKTIFGTVYDLVKVKETLEHRHRMLQSIIDMSNEGIFVLNADKKILLYNDDALKFLGVQQSILFDDIYQYIPKFDEIFQNKNEANVFNIKGEKYLVTIKIVDESVKNSEYIVVLRKTEHIEILESKVRQKLYGKNFKAKYTFEDVITRDHEFSCIKEFAIKAAQSHCDILIYGESGTGKELFAQAMHLASPRHLGPFVPTNVAALQESLIESELFGYEEGAFTGAKRSGKPGIFELAHNGTVFLDEISELPLRLQSKLLRVLQEHEIMRLGSTKITPVNVRVIVATNKNLRTMVNEGVFRSDLYYRLHVLPLTLPSLRNRPDDIELLMEHFLSKLGVSTHCISNNIRCRLQNYKWPGNIRELENLCNYISFVKSLYEKEQTKFEDKILEYIGEKATIEVRVSNDDNLSKENLEIQRYKKDLEAILCELKKAYDKNESMSRVKLFRRLNPSSGLTENQIKHRLALLFKLGMIVSGNTKQGTVITKKGIIYLGGSS